MTDDISRKKIAVVGSGFGALSAVRTLRGEGFDGDLTVISPQAELHYLPGMIWIPAGLRRREDLVVSLESFFRRMKVDHHASWATGLSDDARVVHTTEGDVANDGLLIASGARFIKKLPGMEHVIIPCQGMEAAEKIRERLASMDEGCIAIGFAANPEEKSAVRGGPMFEFLFGIDRQLRREGRRDRFRLVFFNPSEKPGLRLGEKSVQRLLARMAKRDIETRLGSKPTGFEADRVMTEGGDFQADLILFMPGLTGPEWLDNTRLERSPGGMLAADRFCRAGGAQRVYVAGDSGSFPGPGWMPKQAHMADLQAGAAAANLVGELRDRSPSHEFKTELMCIIDELDRGTLVYRSEKRQFSIPANRLMHWAKRRFEKRYLARYR